MAILNTHIQKEVMRFFLLVMVTVLGIYLVVDFFERIDNFVSADIGIKKALIYYIFNLPIIVTQVLPICLLLSIIIVLGLMNKHNEITALRSCGVSFGFVLKPVLILGIFFTALMFLLSEVVVPITVPISNQIWIEDIKKKDIVTTKENNIWMKGDHSITHIKHYNPVEGDVFGISVYYFDDAFRLSKRVDAQKGKYENDEWTLLNVIEQQRDPIDGTYQITLSDQGTHTLNISVEDLTVVAKASEEMNYIELKNYITKVEADGYDATTYKTDLYGKTAFPFVCLIMALFGSSIAVKKHIKEGLPIGVAYGIGVAFLYWIFNSFSLSLGYGEVISPLLAAWIPNIVFSVWGVYLGLDN